MPAKQETDEDEEWQRFQINAVTNIRPQPSTYNVFSIGFGIGCDVMAINGTPFTVVGGCEIDEVAINHFTDRTGAPCYGSVQALRDDILAGRITLPPIDVLSSTLDCASKCKWNRINKKAPDHKDGDQFVKQLELIKLINPRCCYVEMSPPDPSFNRPEDYYALEQGLGSIFPHVQSRIINMAQFGAYTDRCRYICVATSTTAPFTWPPAATKFPGCQEIMTKPEDVPPSDRAPHYTPTKRSAKGSGDPFRAKKIGEVHRGGGQLL